jgi:transcriptional regulator with XRE-family HTH domain
MSVGKRIAERRAELNISQTELAKKVGCSQSALSDLENGKAEGTSFLARFAMHLSVHALWLETGEEPRLLTEPASLVAALPPASKEVLSLLTYLTVRQIAELTASLEKTKASNIEMLRELKELLPLEKALKQ